MKSAKDRQRIERARRGRQRRRQARARATGRPSVLQALTTSTLALPGIAGSALAETPSEQFTGEYSFSRYAEEDIDSSKVSSGSTERYEIDIHQLRLAGPVTDRIDLALDLAHETMTGATPWYIVPPNISAGETEPRVVMTGASVDDARTDALLKGTYYLDSGTASLSTGVSFENDYLAINGGVDGTREYNEKNTVLSGGLGFSYDQIEPTQDTSGTPRVSSETKHSVSLNGGLTQILSRETTIQTGVTYQYAGGFLSDPYKQVYVGGPILADTRPDTRHQISWLTRLRSHFEGIGGTAHLDYALYYDTWNISAHTIEAAWYQTLFGIARLIPSVRYYSQSQADFYAPWFDSSPGSEFSSDYRLSPYGALSYRVRAETRFQTWNLDWILNVGYERYQSSGDLAIGKVTLENPGLVSFDLFSAGFTTRF